MNINKNSSEFTKSIDEFYNAKNGYSRSITLRNALVPVGKTKRQLRVTDVSNYQTISAVVDKTTS